MLLAFDEGLSVTKRVDAECSQLADSHYSRQTPGHREFMPPGSTLVLRNNDGSVVFGWLKQQKRDDGQRGVNCSIFRNESARRASSVVLEAELAARRKWGSVRLFTYIDPLKTRAIMRHGKRVVGFCFQAAGWKPLVHKDGRPHVSTNGLHLLVKLRNHGLLRPQKRV